MPALTLGRMCIITPTGTTLGMRLKQAQRPETTGPPPDGLRPSLDAERPSANGLVCALHQPPLRTLSLSDAQPFRSFDASNFIS